MSGAQLQGKTAVITGANRGLGLAMTRRFLLAGARVVLLCRRSESAQQALAELSAQGVSVGRAYVQAMDLAQLSSVTAASQKVQTMVENIDFLVLNAGVFRVPPKLTQDGLETHFAVNYLGHFLLTARLWPQIERSESARIVGVSSHTEKKVPPIFLDPRSLESQGPWKSYAFSKRCVLSFLLELDRRMQAAGLPHRAVAADPGFVGTSLLSSGGDSSGWWGRWRNRWMQFGGSLLGQSPEQGSRTLWHGCVGAMNESTGLVFPQGFLGLFGKAGWAEPSRASRESAFVAELWRFSEAYAAFPALAEVHDAMKLKENENLTKG